MGWLVGSLLIMTKKNWYKLGIQELQARYGYSKALAEVTWERAYRKALRRVRSAGVTSDINVAREVYASTFYRGSQLFEIDLEDLSPMVEVADEFAGQDLAKAFTEKRFEHMAQKYAEIGNALEEYKQGSITYKKFRQIVKEFRDSNLEYQKAGS